MNRVIVVFLVTLMASAGHAAPRIYPTRELAGHKLGDLFSVYTGIKGVAPEEARIDFEHQLEKMWEAKYERAHHAKVVVATGKDLLREYRKEDPQHMTRADYEHHLDAVLRQVHEDISWDKVGRIEHLTAKQLSLVREIAMTFRARDLVAYELTELMPCKDGKLNKKVFEFLLRNAGRRYVESIPALHDKKVSFGPYQFTEFAWYEGKGGPRGGSRLNAALRHAIPHGSVAKLRGDQHHIAAFLLMVDNLSWIVKHLDKKEFTTLEKIWKHHHNDLVELVATAHHAPHGKYGATGTARRWLDNGARKKFSVSCSRTLAAYATKTAANLEALER